jgi:hypothetical protein
MEEQTKNTIILCEKIRVLTKEIEKLSQKNIKLEIIDIPAAGIIGTKWNVSIINWKNSLRF